jgi:hypothetical protein
VTDDSVTHAASEGMLKAHMDEVENTLLATSRIPANSGHTLHRGTPREAFIRQFLESHLAQTVAIGTGEVIDALSQPREQRTQVDVVIYKRDYPKLHLGGGIDAFLAESVVAAIEVKSVLTEVDLGRSIENARTVKALQRNIVQSFYSGHQPPAILNFVVAYDGPVHMTTVHDWTARNYRRLGIQEPDLPPTGDQRRAIASPALDAVFVLGRGFTLFDNSPFTFVNDEWRQRKPDLHWMLADVEFGSLLMLFMQITGAVSGVSGAWLNPGPYLSSFRLTFSVV